MDDTVDADTDIATGKVLRDSLILTAAALEVGFPYIPQDYDAAHTSFA